MNKSTWLVQNGYLTQSQLAYILQVSTAAVSKALSAGQIRATRVKGWGASVIEIQEAWRVAQSRGISSQEFAHKVQALGRESNWGPVVVAGLLVLLGLGVMYLLTQDS